MNDKTTEGLNTTEIADLLKGPRGTTVKIVISREGTPDYHDLHRGARRDQPQERAGCLLDEAGHRLRRRSSASARPPARRWRTTCKRLGENNIKGLVLDLRENPGGLLNEGVAVADHFLPKNALIVSHRGRSAPEKAYVAQHGNRGRDYPMVVLVNRYSASAAEIVTGALQDHDRALDSGRDHVRQGPGADRLSAERQHRRWR